MHSGDYSVTRTCNSDFAGSNEVRIYAVTKLNLKLFIEGFYSGTGMMDNGGSGGCLFVSGVSTNQTDVDTLYISLVDPTSMTIMHFDTVVLQTNGTCQGVFTSVYDPGEDYYIRVKHRNSVETWSVPTLTNAFMNYTFTTSAVQAFGNNMKEVVPGVFAFFSGDTNQDGAVDGSDFLDMDVSIQNGDGGYAVADLNGDGAVDGSDFLMLDPNIQLGVGAVIP